MTALPPLAILDRSRERANRILGQNASNSAKALARDALELCEMIDDFRSELRKAPGTNLMMRLREKLGV